MRIVSAAALAPRIVTKAEAVLAGKAVREAFVSGARETVFRDWYAQYAVHGGDEMNDPARATVLEKIPEVLKQHSSFKRDVPLTESTHFRSVFGQPNDPSPELLHTTLVFNIRSMGQALLFSANTPILLYILICGAFLLTA